MRAHDLTVIIIFWGRSWAWWARPWRSPPPSEANLISGLSSLVHMEIEIAMDMCQQMTDICHMSRQISTLLWPLTLPGSSPGIGVSNRHMLTRNRHVSPVWEHVYWISGEILPQFDPSHSPVAHLEAELVTDTCRHVKEKCNVSENMSIEFLAKFYPNLTTHTPL